MRSPYKSLLAIDKRVASHLNGHTIKRAGGCCYTSPALTKSNPVLEGRIMADSQPSGVRISQQLNVKPVAAGRPAIGVCRRCGGNRVVELTCDNPACGATYVDYRKRVSRAKRHFCSRACYHACKTGNGNPKWRGGVKSRACKICGKTFSDRSYTGQIYCSVECKNKSLVCRLAEPEALALIKQFRESGMPLYEFAPSIGFIEETLRRQLMLVVPDDFRAATEVSRLKFNTVYRRGRNFELKIRRHLVSLGYVCMVSPQSHGPADLLAVKNGKIFLIQCKQGNRIKRKERIALISMSKQAGGIPIVGGRTGQVIAFWIVDEKAGRRVRTEL